MKFQTEKENHDNQINMFRKLLENKDKELEKTYDLLNLRKNELENLTKEVYEIIFLNNMFFFNFSIMI